MVLKFRLTNTGKRPMRLDFLDPIIRLEGAGSRGSSIEVTLGNWTFTKTDNAARKMQPYFESGLQVTIETDLPVVTPGTAVSPTVVTVVPPKQESKLAGMPEVRALSDGRPRISVLGQIDLSGETSRTLVPHSARGDKAFVSSQTVIDIDTGAPKIQRIPGSKGAIQQMPDRPILAGTSPVIDTPVQQVIQPDAMIRAQAELAFRQNLEKQAAAEEAAAAQKAAVAEMLSADPVKAEAAAKGTEEVLQAAATPAVNTDPIPIPRKRPGRKPKAQGPVVEIVEPETPAQEDAGITV